MILIFNAICFSVIFTIKKWNFFAAKNPILNDKNRK